MVNSVGQHEQSTPQRHRLGRSGFGTTAHYRIVVVSVKVWLGEPARISTFTLTTIPAVTASERGLPKKQQSGSGTPSISRGGCDALGPVDTADTVRTPSAGTMTPHCSTDVIRTYSWKVLGVVDARVSSRPTLPEQTLLRRCT